MWVLTLRTETQEYRNPKIRAGRRPSEVDSMRDPEGIGYSNSKP